MLLFLWIQKKQELYAWQEFADVVYDMQLLLQEENIWHAWFLDDSLRAQQTELEKYLESMSRYAFLQESVTQLQRYTALAWWDIAYIASSLPSQRTAQDWFDYGVVQVTAVAHDSMIQEDIATLDDYSASLDEAKQAFTYAVELWWSILKDHAHHNLILIQHMQSLISFRKTLLLLNELFVKISSLYRDVAILEDAEALYSEICPETPYKAMLDELTVLLDSWYLGLYSALGVCTTDQEECDAVGTSLLHMKISVDDIAVTVERYVRYLTYVEAQWEDSSLQDKDPLCASAPASDMRYVLDEAWKVSYIYNDNIWWSSWREVWDILQQTTSWDESMGHKPAWFTDTYVLDDILEKQNSWYEKKYDREKKQDYSIQYFLDTTFERFEGAREAFE